MHLRRAHAHIRVMKSCSSKARAMSRTAAEGNRASAKNNTAGWISQTTWRRRGRMGGSKTEQQFPQNFKQAPKKTPKTGVFGGGVSTATDTISLFCKSNKKKRTWWGRIGKEQGEADQLCNSCKNIGTGSIPARRDQSYGLDFSLFLSHQPLHTWLLLPCDVAMQSHDWLRAAVRETQVLNRVTNMAEGKWSTVWSYFTALNKIIAFSYMKAHQLLL